MRALRGVRFIISTCTPCRSWPAGSCATPRIMGWELKQLRARNLTTAVTLAKHYRDLNQPEDAESICRDILEVSPGNDDAWRMLGLALTDQFPTAWMTLFDDACAAFSKLSSEYERVYYTAITWERYAKAQLAAGSASNAIHAYGEALRLFEKADNLGTDDDPRPILHYNRCIRALTTTPELVHVSSAPPALDYDFGD